MAFPVTALGDTLKSEDYVYDNAMHKGTLKVKFTTASTQWNGLQLECKLTDMNAADFATMTPHWRVNHDTVTKPDGKRYFTLTRDAVLTSNETVEITHTGPERGGPGFMQIMIGPSKTGPNTRGQTMVAVGDFPALPGWAGIALAALLFVTGVFVFGNRRRELAA